jgi:hypothetical protein
MNNNGDLDRVWKEFGKQTEAGKLLYELYGVRFRPDKFVKYPKLKLKSKEELNSNTNKDRPKSSNNLKNAAKKINYPDLDGYKNIPTYNKVDFIPKRKKQNVIQQEIDDIKNAISKDYNTNVYSKNKLINRKMQIEKLQDNFQYQERTSMPKGARLPGLKMVSNNTTSENELKNSEQPAIKPTFNKHNRREELNYLYSQIIKEIDERYSYMEEMKNLGKNMDQVIMVEIKERIDELKKIQKMIDEFDKK